MGTRGAGPTVAAQSTQRPEQKTKGCVSKSRGCESKMEVSAGRVLARTLFLAVFSRGRKGSGVSDEDPEGRALAVS